MVTNLAKGESTPLVGPDFVLEVVQVGLGWDAGDSLVRYDLDLSAFLLNSGRKVPKKESFVFYNNLKSPCGAATLASDNVTGSGEAEGEDDETLLINLSLLPAEVESVCFVASIYEAGSRNQTFGHVDNAYIRLLDYRRNRELVRYQLDEDFSIETAIVFAELYQVPQGWGFRALGRGHESGLWGIASEFGVRV